MKKPQNIFRTLSAYIFVQEAGGMDLLSAAALGTALAMDAMTVSVIYGMNVHGSRVKGSLVTAGTFAFFQMFMPILGWSIGKVGIPMLSGREKIAAFAILVFLGVKMIIDSRSKNKTCTGGAKGLLLAAVATSIDALASGIVLPVSVGAVNGADVFCAAAIIGAVTFAISFGGYFFGSVFRRVDPVIASAVGGAILILIGIKTLIV